MKKMLVVILLAFLFLGLNAQKYTLHSPDKKLTVEIEVNRGIAVKMMSGNESLISLNGLSIISTSQNPDFTEFQVKKVIQNSVNETVKPVIRDKSEMYVNQYNEMQLVFKANYSITFRLFNEGLAYRFATSAKDSLTILKENLTVQLAENDSLRFQPSKSFNSSYETPYEFRKISAIENGNLCHLPALVEKQNGSFVMITEADLYHYPGMWLTGTGKSELKATNPPFPKKYTNSGDIYGLGQIAEKEDFIAKVEGTRTYPWRIFAVAENEADLITNNMVYLLASPTELQDVSWIKPGIVMFDWWGKSNIYGVNFKAGGNTETAKYYIDFCAAHGFRYFLFDDGWCSKDDLLHEVSGLNIAEVTAYAKSKGVDVMLWVIWHAVQKQWDQAFDQFEKWGIKGIKMDFMNRDDQPMVEFYEAVARKAAEKKMLVNFHGAYKPCGLSRKYPNVLTREALIEFEYNGWTNSDNPEHHNLLPYIRMFTGPMDYIPATMRNSTKDNFRPLGDYPMGQGTRAHAMALFVILSSPMEMLPDSPSDYYREKECTNFLTKIPVEWDETRLLEGKISKYTVLARRSGESWFVGAITDWTQRSINLSTVFLKPGKYHIEMIEDGINANTRAEDYKRVEKDFSSGEVLKLKLAAGGGWVARITPVK
ncbi:MAG TPA: alpha-glucosidase [Prolixibacteraceae bacterium]|nr:alpha-glucosidase [Prolixibacteraceae bacterium]